MIGKALAGVVLTAAACVAAQAQVQGQAMGRDGLNLVNNQMVVQRAMAAGGSRVHQPFTEPVTAAKIRAAVDDAILFLRSQQQANGQIGEYGNDGGPTALATLAILAAGGDPVADPTLQRALDYLAKVESDNTYVRGIRANVWEYALRKSPGSKEYRKALEVDFQWLVKALGGKEGWRYNSASTDWDNSCTQYGVLGIWAAARAGLDPGENFWKTMSKHFRSTQCPDGGWSYTGNNGSTPNMATAGLASMFLVLDMYHGKNFYSVDKPRTFTAGEAAEVLSSIERGMTWLGQAKGQKNDGYYLYGIERTGVASGRKYFGGEDWFKEGSLAVLRAQQPNGAIPLGNYGDNVCHTAWCTLFLVYGGAPVAFNKLEYGKDQDWNLNPRDLANVSRYLWSAYERPMNWQTVSLAAPASEFEAPILFISGSKALELTDEQVGRLREYIQRGGTILAEPADHAEAFAGSVEKLVARLFPPQEYPSYRLAPLPAEHGLFSVLKQDWKKQPKLRGVSDGSRLVFVESQEYYSADFQMDRADSDGFKLAMNLLFYATDLDTLEGKFASILPNTPPAAARAESLPMARVKYEAGAEHPRDWDAAALCWQKFAPYATHVTGCKFEERPPVELGKSDLGGIRLLHLTGRFGLKLSAEERRALKAYVDGGGTVLVDAYAGSPEFARSAKAVLEEVFGPLAALPADHILAEGRFKGGQDLHNAVGFKLPVRQLLRARGETASGEKLLVAKAGTRPAVIFSEFDIGAAMAGIQNYRALAYKPAAARRIAGNILAYLAVD